MTCQPVMERSFPYRNGNCLSEKQSIKSDTYIVNQNFDHLMDVTGGILIVTIKRVIGEVTHTYATFNMSVSHISNFVLKSLIYKFGFMRLESIM